ncbi:hypothetical protein R1sor_014154 [Riccia sorocarpa]|uniref:Uncharacterized protein n=1 Tax=Riccia sorocarpa TaxID=122646 RepID=A0ABD3HCC2_9MARC
MDFKMLKRTEVIIRAKTRWLEHPSWTRDKRKRWSLALGIIRKLLMKVQEDDKRRVLPLRNLEEHVEDVRLRVKHDTSIEAKEMFEEAITKLRRREHEEAEQCRRKCKITWLKEGEAPTKYFFRKEEVVTRIDKQMTEEDNRNLEEVPSDEFITRIVMEMPKEKSPGIDGVMVEIQTIGWES